MAVYRFRVFIEDDHEIYRDIEILGRQRFADLHRAIVQHFNFQQDVAARYDSADQSWYQGDTVVELDVNLEGDHQKIANHIFDPHQRFLCQTESYNEVWLAIELHKIVKEEEGVVYPRSIRSVGEPPYYTQPPPEPIKDDVEDVSTTSESADMMFDADGPSEDEIEAFQKEAEAAIAGGKVKAPKVDMEKLKAKAEEEEENDEDDDKGDGFGEFDVDDLM